MSLLQITCKQIFTYPSSSVNHILFTYSPIGILFQEFVIFMIILQNYAPIITSNCDGLAQLGELLDMYDRFNNSVEKYSGGFAKDADGPILPGETYVTIKHKKNI